MSIKSNAARGRMSSKPRQPAAEYYNDVEYDGILRRLLVAVYQLKSAAQNFGDLASVPKEHVPAALVMQEATKELDQLYTDLDSWHVRHIHAPKKPLEPKELAAIAGRLY